MAYIGPILLTELQIIPYYVWLTYLLTYGHMVRAAQASPDSVLRSGAYPGERGLFFQLAGVLLPLYFHSTF